MEDLQKRAALFDTAATAYEHYRPDYPPALIDDMLRFAEVTSSARLLEVGCGTGKATALVARRGCRVDCVDPGAHLLAIARGSCSAWPGVRFFLGRFEEVSLVPDCYDLLYAAQAFHWTDPALRWTLCRRYVRPGGTVALIYNYGPLQQAGPEKDLGEELEAITAGAMRRSDHQTSVQAWTREMEGSGVFSSVQVRRYSWQRSFTAEQYAGLVGTYSDFMMLPADLQEKVTEAILRIIGASGGRLQHHYESFLFLGSLAPGDTAP